MPDSFFTRIDEGRFAATEHTVGPWSPDAQHAGPPAALLGRTIEVDAPRENFQVARITYEIVRPVPVAALDVSIEVVRPGRSVELLEASLGHDGTEVMRARAWRIRTQPLDEEATPPARPPRPLPETAEDPWPGGPTGYLAAMEIRFATGSFVEPGPATAWFRMRHPLVDGEEVRPLSRILIAADSGNGISAALDWREWFFINTDLSVYLHRLPRGEWVCLDAQTVISPDGIGLATSDIFDERGPLGRGLQSLFVGRRS